MARYREEAEREAAEKIISSSIETVKGACPICRSDVKGDDIYMFYCKKCNILFKRDELLLESQEHVNAVLRQRVAKHYEKDKEKLKIIDEPIKLKTIKSAGERSVSYIASLKSNVLHVSNCPFAKNIKKANRKVFKSLADAHGFKLCKCI